MTLTQKAIEVIRKAFSARAKTLPRAVSVGELMAALEECPPDAVVLIDLQAYGVRANDAPYVYAVTYNTDQDAPHATLHVQGTELTN